MFYFSDCFLEFFNLRQKDDSKVVRLGTIKPGALD